MECMTLAQNSSPLSDRKPIMLVLSRKPGEKVCVGPDITITVLEARGSRVRIGIDAPYQVRITRGELGNPPMETPIRKEEQSLEAWHMAESS
jgi:carbon storage regulator CsrA